MSALHTPPIIAAAGVTLAALPSLFPVGALSVGMLQASNVLAFCTNVAAVSIPGRIDSEQDSRMRQGDLNPSSSTRLISGNIDDPVSRRNRMLLRPAGWAFAIWGPIYIGEAVFCAAQFADGTGLAATLPDVTAAFVAANLYQALWCASFRPSFDQGWHKYISAAMLAGTAFSLSTLPADLSWYFVPMVMHFGWTTAATLVNLNGSLAMSDSISDSKLVAAGHGSTVLGTILGAGLTLSGVTTPVYGLTVAWALAAVSSGVSTVTWPSETLQKGSGVQKALCLTGSVLCVAAAVFVSW